MRKLSTAYRERRHQFPACIFNSAEDWPMFQLAYVTAQTLGSPTRRMMPYSTRVDQASSHDRSIDRA